MSHMIVILHAYRWITLGFPMSTVRGRTVRVGGETLTRRARGQELQCRRSQLSYRDSLSVFCRYSEHAVPLALSWPLSEGLYASWCLSVCWSLVLLSSQAGHLLALRDRDATISTFPCGHGKALRWRAFQWKISSMLPNRWRGHRHL